MWWLHCQTLPQKKFGIDFSDLVRVYVKHDCPLSWFQVLFSWRWLNTIIVDLSRFDTRLLSLKGNFITFCDSFKKLVICESNSLLADGPLVKFWMLVDARRRSLIVFFLQPCFMSVREFVGLNSWWLLVCYNWLELVHLCWFVTLYFPIWVDYIFVWNSCRPHMFIWDIFLKRETHIYLT